MRDGIRNLGKSRFITKKLAYDGSVIVSLTEKGRLRALNASFRRLANKKEHWDKKWRMVALRYRLKAGEFYELQESLFLYPYD